MSTVVALQSFVGVLENDVLEPPRVVVTSLGTDTFPGAVKKPGRSIQVVKGQMYENNHPAVRKWPEMFGLPDMVPFTPVEQATAAPGERRGR
jgi:hypothetical protein